MDINADTEPGYYDIKPSYDELVDALKDTHKLYAIALRKGYGTHDITRIMSNEFLFQRIESGGCENNLATIQTKNL